MASGLAGHGICGRRHGSVLELRKWNAVSRGGLGPAGGFVGIGIRRVELGDGDVVGVRVWEWVGVWFGFGDGVGLGQRFGVGIQLGVGIRFGVGVQLGIVVGEWQRQRRAGRCV